MDQQVKPPKHLHTLDALRGVAAIAVVAFHYSNFFTVRDILPPNFSRADLPFYGIAPLVFKFGWLSVDLFFTISGFVFFWLYAAKIAQRTISTVEFTQLRVSRLYPLHLATLLLVAAGQAVYAQLHPDIPYFVYKSNTLPDFLRQLAFASNWWPHSELSFNGPVWSISIEVLLYAIFFVFCRLAGVRPWVMALMSVAGFWLVYRFHTELGRGVGSFFLGGLVFLAYVRILAAGTCRQWALAAAGAALLIWIVGLVAMPTHWSFLPPHWAPKADRYFPVVLMFPSLILALALFETATGAGAKVSWLGDISYSTYLLHFPLQLAFVLVADQLGYGRSIFYSHAMFLLFFAVLIALAFLSFKAFERPAQRLIRNALPMKTKRVAASSGG
jgi:peptidoglycan/LPS O-acetylase OafA/YrhL